MKTDRSVPVILLAFANDRTQGTESRRFLDELANERIRFREILQELEQKGLWQVETLPDVKADDIRKRFLSPVFRDRIAVFHFSGHADAGRHCLLLEADDGTLDAVPGELLANFLGRQASLNLVVLSGCNTQELGNSLLKAGVGAVLSTTDAQLDDSKAARFAESFYMALATHRTLEQAYQDACSAVALVGERSNSRGIGVDEDNDEPQGPPTPTWTLQFRPGAEFLRDWRLLEADPLQGLPLPNDIYLPAEPFQLNLLQSYRRQDALVFFGRGQVIRKLYDKLTSPHTYPIVLLCGQSGVGKSSLLAAGLLPRMEASHTVVLLRRPQRDQLMPELIQLLGGGENLAQAWRNRETVERKPVLLVIDQLEELLAEGSDGHAEWLVLLDALQPLFAAPDYWPQGKLLLGFRKEWLAEVDHGLSASRLPVGYRELLERLDRDGIVEAIEGIAQNPVTQDRWQLTVDPADGPERLATKMAGDLLADNESPIAPTLQILLSRMWHAATQKNRARPQFDTELYQSISRQGLHLADFLANELILLEQHFPEASKSGLVLDLLYEHTTDLGRAGEKAQTELQQLYPHCWPELSKLLEHCKLRFLLADCGTNQPATRLAHDTLAPLVRREFERSNKPGQVARHLLERRNLKPNHKLSSVELKKIKPGLIGMRILTEIEREDIHNANNSWRLSKFMNVLITGLVILIFIGVTAWVTEGHKFIDYYYDYEFINGFPEGVSKVPENEVHYVSSVYKFIRWGWRNPPTQIMLVNGTRNTCPADYQKNFFSIYWNDNQACNIRITTRSSKSSHKKEIDKLLVSGIKQDVVYEIQYITNGHTIHLVDKVDGTEVLQRIYEYNKRGQEVLRKFVDANGASTRDSNGCHAYKTESSMKMRVSTCLNQSLEAVDDNNNISKTTVESSDLGRPQKIRFANRFNQLVKNVRGFASASREFDSHGNMTKEEYFDENQMPTLNDEGYSAVRLWYDRNGQITKVSCYRQDGSLINNVEGWATILHEREGKVFLDDKGEKVK